MIEPNPANYNSPNKDKGIWGPWSHCGGGGSVVFMVPKMEGRKNSGDNTGLNGLQLGCSQRFKWGFKWLQSKDGSKGTWMSSYSQEMQVKKSGYNPIVSVQLKKDPFRAKQTDDYTMASGIRFQDIKGNTYHPAEGEGFEEHWGGWRSCPIGTVIVGFRTYVVPDQGDGDDTGLERVQFQCGPPSCPNGWTTSGNKCFKVTFFSTGWPVCLDMKQGAINQLFIRLFLMFLTSIL